VKARHIIDRFTFEKELRLIGLTRVAGLDEAGRGPLAGPVVAAAVILPEQWQRVGPPGDLKELNDSKQLTALRREQFFAALTTIEEVRYAIACVEAELVDGLNILRATHRAMNQALAQLRPAPEHVLVDGTEVKALCFPQTPLVRGDERSYSIAAAGILAKVTRDRLMVEHDQRWPVYGFAQHKGYGTPRHLAALAEHGPCPIHRRSFSPVRVRDVKSDSP
jgi:ribonuclease HII